MQYPSFKSRLELRAWLQSQSPQIRADYARAVLIKRKEEKNLQYAPSQVELRSLPEFPSIKFYNVVFGGYHKLCEELGLKNKYRAEYTPFVENKTFDKTIIIDSREQLPIKFSKNIKTITAGLKFGDYCIENKTDIVLERKSLSDMIGTLSKNIDRFRAELTKAKEANSSLFILVECDYEDALNFDKKDWIRRFTKVKPYFIWHQIRDLIQQFPHIQFLFCGGRPETARIALKLLYNGEILKNYDLQYLLDQSIL